MRINSCYGTDTLLLLKFRADSTGHGDIPNQSLIILPGLTVIERIETSKLSKKHFGPDKPDMNLNAKYKSGTM